MKNIEVETEAWCPENCKRFDLGIEQNEFFADYAFGISETIYYCKNLDICRNTVENYKEAMKCTS